MLSVLSTPCIQPYTWGERWSGTRTPQDRQAVQARSVKTVLTCQPATMLAFRLTTSFAHPFVSPVYPITPFENSTRSLSPSKFP